MARILFIALLLLAYVPPMRAQGTSARDSFAQRQMLLEQFLQANNYEKAALEAEALLDLSKRFTLPYTPKWVALVSSAYFANKNERAAARFLAEADLAARRDLNLTTRKPLLDVLAAEYRRWKMEEQALICQSLALVAQDSMLARQRRGQTLALQHQVDSLAQLLQTAHSGAVGNETHFKIEKQRAYALALALGLLLLALLFAHYRNTEQWRGILVKKELEFELIKANIQQIAEEKAVRDAVNAVEALQTQQQPPKPAPANTPPPALAASPNQRASFGAYPAEPPELVALVIEPNRQIVLYLKSLLSDRFQVETAQTPAEGLQLASQLLPDLVVCDAILNGTTGIEVARKIKLSERTNHVPVVLLTDKFGNEGKLDALRAGADAWFTRPVLDDEFDVSVKRLLDGRKTLHERFARFMQLYFTDARIPADNPFLGQTVQLIEQNLADPNYMADDIARRMQMTKPHFSKKLKVLTGKEPVQLIRELRLEKAKILLEKRAGTPQAISELVGFANPGTFSLAFKEYFGENTSLLYSVPPRIGG